jgi:replication factor C subunit 3/5
MFLIDKYKINKIDDIIIHKSIYNKLVIGSILENTIKNPNEIDEIIQTKNYELLNKFHYSKPSIYSNYERMTNLFIHGPPGCGKHTLIKLLLIDIFDESIENTFVEMCNIKGYGNKAIPIEIVKSKYHLVIEPNNTGFDKYLIQEIAKEYAEQKLINMGYQKFPFKVILINNVDNLNIYAQASLRCTMEKYYKTCRFILCGTQTSKVMEPLTSRCLNIRIPAPSNEEMTQLIYHILLSENKLLKKSTIAEIVLHGQSNIKTTLWTLQMYLYKITNFELGWKKSLNQLVEFAIEFKKSKPSILTDKLIPKTRNILYDVFTTTIPGIEILYEIIQQIITSQQFDNKLLDQIIQISSDVESRLNKGKRSIIHLDYFMCKVYQTIYIFYNTPNKQRLHK